MRARAVLWCLVFTGPHGPETVARCAGDPTALLRLDCLSVVTPSGGTLVKHCSLDVRLGCNLLVTGPNGSGKSSLFRILRGLWPNVRGAIHVAGGRRAWALGRDISYVPQQPYLSHASLLEQLIYPLSIDGARCTPCSVCAGATHMSAAGRAGRAVPSLCIAPSSARSTRAACSVPLLCAYSTVLRALYPRRLLFLHAVIRGGGVRADALVKLGHTRGKISGKGDALAGLHARCADLMAVVKLSYLVDREGWAASKQWATVLSLGEQQRLGMARLFFQKCAPPALCAPTLTFCNGGNAVRVFGRSAGLRWRCWTSAPTPRASTWSAACTSTRRRWASR